MSDSAWIIERPTAEIVADLRETQVVLPASTGNRQGMSETSGTTVTKPSALGREAADRLAELDEMVNVTLDAELTAYETEAKRIDALRPSCPACGGTAECWLERKGVWCNGPCPDCTDGKMPVERMAAIVSRLFNPALTDDLPPRDGDEFWFVEMLRGVRS